jgi:hypothetical protein
VQPLFPWKSNNYGIFEGCVYSPSYRVCNAHVPYSQLWPARFYNTFPNYLINGTVFGGGGGVGGSLDIKWAFWFPQQILMETFVILRSNERDMIKKSGGLHEKCPLFLSDFNEAWIFWAVFLKNIQYELSRKSVQWETSCSMQTDGQTWRRFSQYCERS